MLLSHTTFSRPRSNQTLSTEQLARRWTHEPARRRRSQRRPGRCCEGMHSHNALRSERRRGKNGANQFHSTRHGGSRQNAGSACVPCSAALSFADRPPSSLRRERAVHILPMLCWRRRRTADTALSHCVSLSLLLSLSLSLSLSRLASAAAVSRMGERGSLLSFHSLFLL